MSELFVISLKWQGPIRIAQLLCIVQSMKWSRKFEATFRIVPKEALKNSNFENNISVSASFIRIESELIENSGKAFRDVSLLLKPVDFQVRGGMQNI